ncbi:aldo/keto reductase [Atopobacter sp. AH10]|uniref:aldo/keto reductase n=1 Tax=Atopobacter sp. AH10 TaxID=2315861 RepID=UPI000EF21FBF|nr:aldo/keto reductase [Atopobacter sp. AH10]RLK62764.1 aldo/keto reductase [Atopobacter sp. AH10]
MLHLPNGEVYPNFGIGSWYLGENTARWEEERDCIRYAIENGVNLIDTAEMYGDGRAESLIGQAIKGVERDSLLIVSKVYPWNASLEQMKKSCLASLERLGTDYLDMYLLHWPGNIPLEETVQAFEDLKKEGLIRAWGVSNFDVEDMEALEKVADGDQCQINQVLYHLASRGIEYALKPTLDRKGIPLMAYCPLGQAGRLKKDLLTDPSIQMVADRHGVSRYQVLLAFILNQEQMMAIPRTGNIEHMADNLKARELRLSKEDYALLDQAFPAPDHRVALDTE